ncbi:MAG: diaminopimelate decarboxylase, partial [Cyanobacteriota bacterium]|nr:diaminopimelate decarboxylase [Cyanobacteriota bacterium]
MVSTLTTATLGSTQYLAIRAEGSEASPNQSLLPLTATVNAADHLVVGGCDVVDLVQQFGSPLYILDDHTLRTACQQYRR